MRIEKLSLFFNIVLKTIPKLLLKKIQQIFQNLIVNLELMRTPCFFEIKYLNLAVKLEFVRATAPNRQMNDRIVSKSYEDQEYKLSSSQTNI